MAKKKDSPLIKVHSIQPDPLPANTEDLRALLIDITKGRSQVNLGRKSQVALGRILDVQDSNHLLSITTLSEQIDTNPSTITRLARALGYQGFGAFQKALLATRLQQPATFYLDQAQVALSGAEQPVKQRAAQLCHENQANIEHFVHNFDTINFNKAIDLIANAPRIAVYGIRQFHALAAFLVYGLRLIRSDVVVLNANSLGVAEEIAAMDRGDVCIVASVAPYSIQVVEAANVAHERGLNVVAITDFASSPLVVSASTSIFAPHQSSFISNSITSYFAVAECLINAVAATNSKQAEQAVADRQKLIERMNIEDR